LNAALRAGRPVKGSRASARAGLIVVVAFLSTFSTATAAVLMPGKAFPAVGEETPIELKQGDGAPIPGARITATYRPGSEVAVEESVGVTDSLGRVGTWKPGLPGIVTLQAAWTEGGAERTASVNMSVRFSSTPWRGVAILAMAGVILYGGVIFSQVRLRLLR